MSRLAVLIFFSLLTFGAYSQSFTSRNYSTAQGLPSSEVYDIYQDKSGFMWFSTDNGIVRFDGSEFRLYHVKDGLTDPVVFGFQEDDDGRVWFRTYSGKLSYMENGVIHPYEFNSTLNTVVLGGLINFHYFAKEKELWFSVRNRYGKINNEGHLQFDTIAREKEGDAIHYKTVHGKELLVRSNKTMDIKMMIFDGKKFPIQLQEPTFSNKVFCEVSWNSKRYFSVFNNLLEFDGKSIKTIFYSKFPIISLYVDDEDHLWVGYLNGGAERYDRNFGKWVPPAVLSKSVTSVKQSRDGSIWLSTLENGVYVMPNLNVQHFDLPPDSRVKNVAFSSSKMMMGDKSGLVRFYDTGTKSIVKEMDFGFDVLSIFSDRRDNIWISSHSHLSIFDKNFRFIKTFEFLNVVDYHEFENGQGCVGLGSQRFYRFNANLELTETITSPEIYRQILISDSSVFLAARIGLFMRDLNFANERAVKGFDNCKISELLLLNDTSVLISTVGTGFYLLNPTTLKATQYNQTHQFFSDNIYGVILKNNNLWFATEHGLVTTKLQSLLSGKPEFQYINSRSGLDSDLVKFLGHSKDEIWAFSETDFSVVPDTLTRFANKKPSFYLKEIRCNEDAIDPTTNLEFESNQNNLRISYGFISFTNDLILLKYRIHPDDPWIYTNERIFQFSSLAPGDYSFQLQYSADNHHWEEAILPISFSIDPPWYRKWYVYPISLVISLLIAYLIFKNKQTMYREKTKFLNIITEHQEKLIQSQVATIERERNRIAKELHDGVGTNLTAIKLSVRQLLTNHQDPLADEIEEQFQVAIGDIKNIIYDLTPPTLERYGLFIALKNYISKISKNIPIAIEVKTFGPDIDNFNLNIIVFRVMQELLSNSIKHSNASKITVHLNSFEDLLSIIYEDNGVGFVYDPVQSGLGLDNVESRIRSLNGSLKFDSGKFGVSYNIDIPLSEFIKKENYDAN
jgi:signal transduction histidine kinase/ligand-binding sensor domain-containing protein